MEKVSLYINEKVWRKFREWVIKEHGSLRTLSAEAKSLLRSRPIEEESSTTFERSGVRVKDTISSEDIRLNRPRLRSLPSDAILKKMNSSRLAEACFQVAHN